MASFDPEATHTQLESILALIKDRDAEAALSRIGELVSDLRSLEAAEPQGSDRPAASNRKPEPRRLVSAHLKAAEMQIEDTHLALAEESLEKALGVVLDARGPAIVSAGA